MLWYYKWKYSFSFLLVYRTTNDLWMLTLDYTNLLVIMCVGVSMHVHVRVCFQHRKSVICGKDKTFFFFSGLDASAIASSTFCIALFLFSSWECNVRWLTLLLTGPQDPKALFNFTFLCFPSCVIAFRVGSPSFCLWVFQSMLWPPFLCWVPLHYFAHWI